MPGFRKPRTSHRAGMAMAGAALVATALLVLPRGAAVAYPALEYGPEAEATFVALCIQQSKGGEADCRRLCEALQARLGYEAFLEKAELGPAGFAPSPALQGGAERISAAAAGNRAR